MTKQRSPTAAEELYLIQKKIDELKQKLIKQKPKTKDDFKQYYY